MLVSTTFLSTDAFVLKQGERRGAGEQRELVAGTKM